MPPRKSHYTQKAALDAVLREDSPSPPSPLPEKEQAPSSSEALLNEVVQALTTKLDLDGLAKTLVGQVADRLVGTITLAELSEAIAAQHGDEIKARLTQAVLNRVSGI
jgi:hypothetical protein